ncbi:MAG: secondary thiamine-phosphate synthase enzyme YjbQ [Chromatocurvus sp.]
MLPTMWSQHILKIRTRGRGTYNVTAEIDDGIAASGITTGLAHLFLQHTSASLILCETADPDVRRDLEGFLSRLAPDGDPGYRHDQEGPDDMAAHLRSVLTSSSLTIPIAQQRLALGTWQGIYLYEHRTQAHARSVVITLQGSDD